MNKRGNDLPYKTLGIRLKQMREKLQESLAEASGAVEIELDALNRIEQGKERPSEDILLLLISHFGAKEDEATNLWELARYDQQELAVVNMANENQGEAPASVVASGPDVRINYTDMVHIMVNNYGVVVNFMQGSGPNGQPLIVSRVGMSKEHARSVLEVLQKTLNKSESKPLIAPPTKKRSHKKTD